MRNLRILRACQSRVNIFSFPGRLKLLATVGAGLGTALYLKFLRRDGMSGDGFRSGLPAQKQIALSTEALFIPTQ